MQLNSAEAGTRYGDDSGWERRVMPFSGPPLPLFLGGWALIPFAGEKAHYWREVQ